MTQEYIDGLLALVIAQARAVKIPISREICPHVRLNRFFICWGLVSKF